MKNVFYKYDYRATNDAQHLSNRLKENDPVALQRIASDMAPIMGKDCFLVPIPDKIGYATQNLHLANLMSKFYPGVEVRDIMKFPERNAEDAKKLKGHQFNEEELNLLLTEPVPTGKRIFLVDNVIRTGGTSALALTLIPSADVLAHSVDRQTFDRSEYRKHFSGVYLCDGNRQTIFDIADTMTTMKIALKNVNIYDKMSEETIAFVADLYINGVKAGQAKNDGRGGMTNCQGYNAGGDDLIRKAMSYCQSLPPKTYSSLVPGGEPFTVPMTLDNFVDDLLLKFMFEKDMKRGIVYGESYEKYSFMEFNHPLDAILKDPKGVEFIKETLVKVAAKLEEGQHILNTNLPDEIMQVITNKEVNPTQSSTLSEKKRTTHLQKTKPASNKKRPK